MVTESEKRAFIHKIGTALMGLDLQGLFPSVIIAQAALESNWGKSVLAAKYKNYFGIKVGKSGWTGKSVNMSTGEYQNGESLTVRSNFRVYSTVVESILDRNRLITGLDRYKAALSASTPEEQIKAIKAGGYATDPNYVQKVISIINSNNLKDWDELKKKIMNNKTLSSIMLAAGVLLAGVGIYNLSKLVKK